MSAAGRTVHIHRFISHRAPALVVVLVCAVAGITSGCAAREELGLSSAPASVQHGTAWTVAPLRLARAEQAAARRRNAAARTLARQLVAGEAVPSSARRAAVARVNRYEGWLDSLGAGKLSIVAQGTKWSWPNVTVPVTVKWVIPRANGRPARSTSEITVAMRAQGNGPLAVTDAVSTGEGIVGWTHPHARYAGKWVIASDDTEADIAETIAGTVAEWGPRLADEYAFLPGGKTAPTSLFIVRDIAEGSDIANIPEAKRLDVPKDVAGNTIDDGAIMLYIQRMRTFDSLSQRAIAVHELAHSATIRLFESAPVAVTEGIATWHEDEYLAQQNYFRTIPTLRSQLAGEGVDLAALLRATETDGASVSSELIYEGGFAMIGAIRERHSEAAYKALLTHLAAGRGFEEALRRSTGWSLKRLGNEVVAWVDSRPGE